MIKFLQKYFNKALLFGGETSSRLLSIVGIKNIAGSQINPATEETLQAIAGFNIPKHNNGTMIVDGVTETYTFKLDAVTVGVVVFTYTDSTRTELSSWNVTL